MAYRAEMTIPKPSGEAGYLVVIGAICVVFVVLALIDLTRGDAVVASCLWLAWMAFCVWIRSTDAGGLRNWLTDVAGGVAGRLFAETDTAAGEVRFGHELWGRRHIGHRFTLESIESVAWRTHQVPGKAGYNPYGWQASLWYRHSEPAKTLKRQKNTRWRSPHLDGYFFGPQFGRRPETEVLGLAFVELLREAGVPLVEEADGEAETCFVRR